MFNKKENSNFLKDPKSLIRIVYKRYVTMANCLRKESRTIDNQHTHSNTFTIYKTMTTNLIL